MPLDGSGMLTRLRAAVGLPEPGAASMVAPAMRPPVVSAAIRPATKYFDLSAVQAKGPLSARCSPGSRLLKFVRSRLAW